MAITLDNFTVKMQIKLNVTVQMFYKILQWQQSGQTRIARLVGEC
jgi:hypothetical protein